MDELPLDGSGVIYDVTPGRASSGATVDPEALGLKRAKTSALGGSDPGANAALVRGRAARRAGARRDVVLLNAGAALVAAGVVETIEDGIDRAALTVDAGLAAELLRALRAERRPRTRLRTKARNRTGPGSRA